MSVKPRRNNKGIEIRKLLRRLKSNIDVIPFITMKFLSEKQEESTENLEYFQDKYGFTFRDYELLSNILKKHKKDDDSYVSDIYSTLNALKNSNNNYIQEIFTKIPSEIINKDVLDDILNILRLEKDNIQLYQFVNYVQNNMDVDDSIKTVTPPFIELLANLIKTNHEPINVYDPSCYDAQTITALKEFQHATIYEKDDRQYNHIIQNMIINEIPLENVSLKKQRILVDESSDKYDTIISIPYLDKELEKLAKNIDDPRFNKYKTKKYNSIHLINLMEHLDEDGILITTTSQDLLVKKDGQELRKCLIENNLLDAVIEYETGFRTRDITILIINKNKKTEDFLFIKPEYLLPGLLLPDSNENILKSYENREIISKFSNIISKDEIIKNEYNLNPKRYVYTLDYEEKTIDEILNQQEKYSNKIKSLDEEISQLLQELDG